MLFQMTHFLEFTHRSILQTQRLRRNITIKDDQCRPMRALHVFSASIRYMKEVVLRKMQNAIMNLKESDFHWVLTVPAIWEDGAKQFMRIAANEVCRTKCSMYFLY